SSAARRASSITDWTASVAVGSPSSSTARSTASGATGAGLPTLRVPCATPTVHSFSGSIVTVMVIDGAFFALRAGAFGFAGAGGREAGASDEAEVVWVTGFFSWARGTAAAAGLSDFGVAGFGVAGFSATG